MGTCWKRSTGDFGRKTLKFPAHTGNSSRDGMLTHCCTVLAQPPPDSMAESSVRATFHSIRLAMDQAPMEQDLVKQKRLAQAVRGKCPLRGTVSGGQR